MDKPKPTVAIVSEAVAWAIWTSFPQGRRFLVGTDLAVKDYDGRMRILREKQEVSNAVE